MSRRKNVSFHRMAYLSSTNQYVKSSYIAHPKALKTSLSKASLRSSLHRSTSNHYAPKHSVRLLCRSGLSLLVSFLNFICHHFLIPSTPLGSTPSTVPLTV